MLLVLDRHSVARLGLLVAVVVLTVFAGSPGVATAAAPRHGAHRLGVSVSAIAVGRDVLASGTVPAGVVRGAHARARWQVLLQQRVKSHGHTSWRVRARGRLGKRERANRFLLRWRRGPSAKRLRLRARAAGGPLAVRAIVVSGRLVVGQSATISVGLSGPLTVPPSCPSTKLIGVRGSGETEQDSDGYGLTVRSVVDWTRNLDPALDAEYVNYQALAVRWYDLRYYGYRYDNSVKSGITSLLDHITGFLETCRNSKVYLVGQSQGAQVVADTYLDWLVDADRARITRVALTGDPKFKGGQPGPVNVGSFDRSLNGVAAQVSRRRAWPSSDWAKVRSFCADGDPVCNYKALAQAAGCGLSPNCPHKRYPYNYICPNNTTYTLAAANFLVGRSMCESPPPSGSPPGGGVLPPGGGGNQPPPSPPTGGQITEFSISAPNSTAPVGIAAGSDGALWFPEDNANRIGRITTAGVDTAFQLPAPIRAPAKITAGPDGALWFTEAYNVHDVARLTTGGVLTEFPIANGAPGAITAGPDGALWFTECGGGGRIGRITTGGAVTDFPIPSGDCAGAITSGPDGALWFAGLYGDKIGRITTGGAVTEYTLPTASSYPGAITAGSDGALWFTERNSAYDYPGGKIGRITTGGAVTEYPIPTANTRPGGIAAGPDGALWFTEYTAGGAGKIGRITTAGSVTESSIPTIPSWAPSYPGEITAGPDGALWFADGGGERIGRVAP